MKDLGKKVVDVNKDGLILSYQEIRYNAQDDPCESILHIVRFSWTELEHLKKMVESELAASLI